MWNRTLSDEEAECGIFFVAMWAGWGDTAGGENQLCLIAEIPRNLVTNSNTLVISTSEDGQSLSPPFFFKFYVDVQPCRLGQTST